MNIKYPYEEKIIKEAMSLIDRDKVVEYCEIEKDKIQNYLVVYSGTSKKFCGICASRFLQNNYDSAIIIENVSDVIYHLKRLYRKRLMNSGERSNKHLQLFNYDQYLKDNKDDGFDILENHDKARFDLVKKIAYATTYLKYPAIKNIVEKGYYRLAEELCYNDYAAEVLLNKDVKEIKINEQCKKYLNDNNASSNWWLYLHKLNEIDCVSYDQLTYMFENNFVIDDFYNLIVEPNCYSVKSLIEYVNRCVMYQGYEPRKVISDLLIYHFNGKNILKKLDHYPNDLVKSSKFASTTKLKYDCVASREYRNKYHYNYSNRNRYCFKDKDYYIKAENDIDKVTQASRIIDYYDITQYMKENTDYYWLCDAETDKEITLLRINKITTKKLLKNAIRKYDGLPLSQKELSFIKKWLEYRKNIDLSLIKPQYSMV